MRRTDDVSLWPRPLTLEVIWRLWLMRVVVLHPYTKCVSINRPGDPDPAWNSLPVSIKLNNNTNRLLNLLKTHLFHLAFWRLLAPLNNLYSRAIGAYKFYFYLYLTMKLVCKSHLRFGTFLPNLGTLGFWVLELFAMHATDGQTETYSPFPTGAGHNNKQSLHQCASFRCVNVQETLINSTSYEEAVELSYLE